MISPASIDSNDDEGNINAIDIDTLSDDQVLCLKQGRTDCDNNFGLLTGGGAISPVDPSTIGKLCSDGTFGCSDDSEADSDGNTEIAIEINVNNNSVDP